LPAAGGCGAGIVTTDGDGRSVVAEVTPFSSNPSSENPRKQTDIGVGVGVGIGIEKVDPKRPIPIPIPTAIPERTQNQNYLFMRHRVRHGVRGDAPQK
jgi:hypothetical protein